MSIQPVNVPLERKAVGSVENFLLDYSKFLKLSPLFSKISSDLSCQLQRKVSEIEMIDVATHQFSYSIFQRPQDDK